MAIVPIQSEQTFPIVAPASIEHLYGRIPAYDDARIRELMATTTAIESVDDAETCNTALLFGGDLQAEKRAVLAHFDPYCKAANALRNTLAQTRDGSIAVIDREVNRLKALAMGYQQKVERERREAERRAEEERLRQIEEERKRIEAAALEESKRLEAEGRLAEAESVLDNATVEINQVEAMPIVIPPTTPAPDLAAAGGSKRTYYEIDEKNIDVEKLILAAAGNMAAFGQFLKPDMTALRAAARAQKERFCVPGVKVTARQDMALKASR